MKLLQLNYNKYIVMYLKCCLQLKLNINNINYWHYLEF